MVASEKVSLGEKLNFIFQLVLFGAVIAGVVTICWLFYASHQTEEQMKDAKKRSAETLRSVLMVKANTSEERLEILSPPISSGMGFSDEVGKSLGDKNRSVLEVSIKLKDWPVATASREEICGAIQTMALTSTQRGGWIGENGEEIWLSKTAFEQKLCRWEKEIKLEEDFVDRFMLAENRIIPTNNGTLWKAGEKLNPLKIK